MTEDPNVVTWDEAYNATDALLIGIEGLIHAAEMLASDHPGLCNPEPASAALVVVLRCLTEKNDALREMRSAENRAGREMARREVDIQSSVLDG